MHLRSSRRDRDGRRRRRIVVFESIGGGGRDGASRAVPCGLDYGVAHRSVASFGAHRVRRCRQDMPDVVAKEDFDALRKDVDALMEQVKGLAKAVASGAKDVVVLVSIRSEIETLVDDCGR
jgi:hypothetical protein